VRGERALGRDGAANGVPGADEREEEGVALRVELDAAGRLQLVADDAAVVPVDLLVALAELLEQSRRAFDIREKQGDCAGGEVLHGRR
jgi:hypothetical protein